MIGWVAKDKTSSSFPVSAFGPQEEHRPMSSGRRKREDSPGERPARAGTPDAGLYAVDARLREEVGASDSRKRTQKTGKRSVSMYILDNEPSLWWTDHRDAHPTPLSYDELVQRTIDYGTAIRQADPEAVIAGPAEWGWTELHVLAKGPGRGMLEVLRPDRRAHEDLPARRVLSEGARGAPGEDGRPRASTSSISTTYPYSDGVYGDAVDPRRRRASESDRRGMLWDPTYVDRVVRSRSPSSCSRECASGSTRYDPGVGISIGEWNFGARVT